MDVNTTKWTKASASYHFATILGDTFYTIGEKRAETQIPDYFELRFNGPRFQKPQDNYNIMYIEFNTLISLEREDDNFHKLDDAIGQVVSCYTDCIAVRKYAGGDGSLFGILQLINEPVVRSYTEETTPLQQATVEGMYKMEGF